MLHQSFLNVFINAMQAMPDGGRIGVGIRAEGGNVRIEIEDAGQGIPIDLLDKIWDPFFTTKDKGTGLGLGIVKTSSKSTAGGSASPTRTTGRPRDDRAAGPDTRRLRLAMETILIVDDEKNYLLVLSAVLEEEGYEVLTASAVWKPGDPEILRCGPRVDRHENAGMDGIELLERIKAYDPTCR